MSTRQRVQPKQASVSDIKNRAAELESIIVAADVSGLLPLQSDANGNFETVNNKAEAGVRFAWLVSYT